MIRHKCDYSLSLLSCEEKYIIFYLNYWFFLKKIFFSGSHVQPFFHFEFLSNFNFYLLGGYKIWKRLSFFVAMPAVGLCMLNTYLEHQKAHEHGHTRPDFVQYDYLRVRTKRFPWGEGNKSLFHVSWLYCIIFNIYYINSHYFI